MERKEESFLIVGPQTLLKYLDEVLSYWTSDFMYSKILRFSSSAGWNNNQITYANLLRGTWE